jgi:hypothetical protein
MVYHDIKTSGLEAAMVGSVCDFLTVGISCDDVIKTRPSWSVFVYACVGKLFERLVAHTANSFCYPFSPLHSETCSLYEPLFARLRQPLQ